MPALTVGDTAPDFTLETDTAPFRLSAQGGRGTVLFFYADDDTDGCTLENVEFTALAPDFKALGVTVAGVSENTVKEHCKFRDKYRLGIPLIADPEHKAIEPFGLWQPKTLYGRDYIGLVRTTYLVLPDLRIAGVWRATRIKGHAAKVLAETRKILDEA